MGNAKYKIMLIDDEPIAIQVLESHLKQIDEFEIIGTYTNAMESVTDIYKLKPDLLFLDIEMPGIKGVDFLKSLNSPPPVIFTTAYRDYAVEAFDLDVLDYLLKPISFERLFKAINRFIKASETSILNTEKQEQTHIQLKSNKKMYQLKFDEILFVQGLDDYILVHTKNQKLSCYYRMKEMEEKLPANMFIRIHRSTIVNRNQISSFSAAGIEIAGQRFPIGKTYREQVLSILNKV